MSGMKDQIQKAIDQIQDKGPTPEIDFTQHQLDNGYTISTQERVVKEVCFYVLFEWARTQELSGRTVDRSKLRL